MYLTYLTCTIIFIDIGVIYSKSLFIGTSTYFYINAILRNIM